MSKSLIKQIQESPTNDLHKLKKEHTGSLVEMAIDLEIRIRSLVRIVKKLERDYTERRSKD